MIVLVAGLGYQSSEEMSTTACPSIHFFDTLKATVTSKPYAIVSSNEVNAVLNQIDSLAKVLHIQGGICELASAYQQAIDNARSDGYFPIVILPVWKYEAVMAYLKLDSGMAHGPA